MLWSTVCAGNMRVPHLVKTPTMRHPCLIHALLPLSSFLLSYTYIPPIHVSYTLLLTSINQHGYRQAPRRGQFLRPRVAISKGTELGYMPTRFIQMIKSKPRQRRGRGGGAGKPAGAAGAGGARQRYAGSAPAGNTNVNTKVNAKINQAATKPVGGDATKIIISNLPNDVTEPAVRVCLYTSSYGSVESDLREGAADILQDLMQSTVGPVRTVQMAYNAKGQSTGVATVLFKNRGDGNKAYGACKLIPPHSIADTAD